MKPQCIALLSGLLVAAAANAEPHRSAAKHEHGHGELNVAVEGNRVAIELYVPGMDIVGFEHAAKSNSDKAKVERAIAALEKPGELFQMPDAAGCTTVEAKAQLGQEDDGGNGHTEFHATYIFECKEPTALTSIAFGFFRVFAAAESLSAAVLSDKGQGAFQVTRDKPILYLPGSN